MRTPTLSLSWLLATAIAFLGAASPAAAGDWWRPTADQPLALHWVLEDPLDTDDPVQMGLVDFAGNPLPPPDVYSIDGQMNSAATVARLHAMGKKVICYIDAGVYENYRPDAYKFKALKPRIWGKRNPWPGSYWLDVRRIAELEPIMKARMQDCVAKGFDAIEPDEIDGWENDTGFPITYEDQLAYNRALARWAHELGISIGQKGDIIQTRDLVDHFDWTLNEECFQYDECTNPWDPRLDEEMPGLQLYVQQNKAVFIAEYESWDDEVRHSICRFSRENRFNTTRFRLGLPNDGRRDPCSTDAHW